MALEQRAEQSRHPKLKELVVEASRALARLDADRLEELALSCQALNRDLARSDRMGMRRRGRWLRRPGRRRVIWRFSPVCWKRRRPTWM